MSVPNPTPALARLLPVILCFLAQPTWADPEQFKLEVNPGIQFDDPYNGQYTGEAMGFHYEIVQGHAIAEGDMVLARLDEFGRLDIPPQTRGLGQNMVFDRWENGVLPYQFSDEINATQRANILDAVAHWNEQTTMLLIERDNANAEQYPDYVSFEPSNGCASWVGRQGSKQEVWVSDACTVGSIIHELGHAMGLFHEHTRPDRDNFIGVQWENIVASKNFNFEILDAGATAFGDYDYGSIMHYGEYFFSANGQRTVVPPEGTEIGQRIALSTADAGSVDTMYATDLELIATAIQLDDGVEVSIMVSNKGDLGAHKLELRTTLGAEAEWLSISADSGWECLSFAEELRCSRNVLAGEASSGFDVLVDPNGAAIGDLSAILESQTADTRLDNNALNFIAVAEPVAEPASTVEPTATPTSATGSEPEVAAASTASNSTGAALSDGGGATAPGFGIALFWVLLRRRRKAPL